MPPKNVSLWFAAAGEEEELPQVPGPCKAPPNINVPDVYVLALVKLAMAPLAIDHMALGWAMYRVCPVGFHL